MTGADEMPTTGPPGRYVTANGLFVTKHAGSRYFQRVRRCQNPRHELVSCLAGVSANESMLCRSRKTTYLHLGCCTAICDMSRVVTVIDRIRLPDPFAPPLGPIDEGVTTP